MRIPFLFSKNVFILLKAFAVCFNSSNCGGFVLFYLFQEQNKGILAKKETLVCILVIVTTFSLTVVLSLVYIMGRLDLIDLI